VAGALAALVIPHRILRWKIGLCRGSKRHDRISICRESNDKLSALAADLVHRKVAVIPAMTTPAALAAKASTIAVLIVFVGGADPDQFGLVASLDRPGGNVTGVSNLSIGLSAKRIELLCQVMPDAKLIAYNHFRFQNA
jgi:ABC-type uncharacterized transport system substrate-binding protein